MTLAKTIGLIFVSFSALAADIKNIQYKGANLNNEQIQLVSFTVEFPNGNTLDIQESISELPPTSSYVTSAVLRNQYGSILMEQKISNQPLYKLPYHARHKDLVVEVKRLYQIWPDDDFVVLGSPDQFVIFKQDGSYRNLPLTDSRSFFMNRISGFYLLREGATVRAIKYKLDGVQHVEDVISGFSPPAELTNLPAVIVKPARPSIERFSFGNGAELIIEHNKENGSATFVKDGKKTLITSDQVNQYPVNRKGQPPFELSYDEAQNKSVLLVTEKQILVVTNAGVVRPLDVDFNKLRFFEEKMQEKRENYLQPSQYMVQSDGKDFAIFSFAYKKSPPSGETYVMDLETGDLVKVAYSFLEANTSGPTFEVVDGILSMNKIHRKIDLRNLRAENNFFTLHLPVKVVDGNEIEVDPIDKLEKALPNMAESFRLGLLKVYPQGEDFKDFSEKLTVILGQKESPNPAVLAEAGTGKSKSVEAFMNEIIKGNIPSIPRTVHIYELKKDSITQGTKYTGTLEERLKALEATAKSVPVIVYADEVHNLRGAGTHEGNPDHDVMGQLKGSLENGILHMIATSTEDEFQSAYGGDKAIMRRITLVKKEDPNKAQILIMIDGWCERWGYPKLDAETKEYLYYVSNKFIGKGAQPSKATTLLDSAYSRKRNILKSKDVLTKQDIIISLVSSGVDKRLFDEISSKEVLERLQNGWDQKMAGQVDARDAYVELESMRLSGLLDPTKPASILITGPRGTGKTRGAQTYAELTNRRFVRLNMADYGEGGVAEFQKRLAQEIFKDRFAVILFDEIEKASPSIKNILLAIFQDGKIKVPAKLTASASVANSTETVDFSQATLVCTTNAGESFVLNQMQQNEIVSLGFTSNKSTVKKDDIVEKLRHSVMMQHGLKEAAKADGLSSFLVDRMSLIVPAYPSKQDSFRKAVDINLKQAFEHFEKTKGFGFELKNREVFLEFAVKAYFTENMSNRLIETILQKHISKWVAKKLTSDESKKENIKKVLIEFNSQNGESMVEIVTHCADALKP